MTQSAAWLWRPLGDRVKNTHQALCRINGLDLRRWGRLQLNPSLRSSGADVVVALRNGLTLELERSQYITQKIVRYGCFDPVVAEAITRLSTPGAVHIDVGANVGYTAALMAAVARQPGTVVAFEPASRTFARLTRNASAINDALHAEVLQIRREAVGANPGCADLALRAAASSADGLAFIVNRNPAGRPAGGFTKESVPVVRLADVIDSNRPLALVKIDVEGSERDVIEGMGPLLERAEPAIVYEENCAFPGDASLALLDRGYQIRRLDWRGPLAVLGLCAANPRSRRPKLPPGFEPDVNYVASRNMDCVLTRLRGFAWRCA